ncbi:hypothetical protein [Micromonospora narathiwatensis]|uniref:Uncharacterized protein n=1 Tax=Micromonospora narathiwatensis TaxID=299146 RepID=A0A1A8ZZH5_9ACTN|nr:hypothetical protein [Micromonospora narathiwatensis]SBT49243.1 hypothetical protein GA0070621_3389 [Micromonospora narathiwatensis]
MQLDGFVLGHLPAGTGELVEDFTYEWDDVAFNSRVWEREIDGGHQVDLQVLVLRGPRLATAAALRDFLAEYHERDPDAWALSEFQPGEAAGFIGENEAFWLVEPGVAVQVRFPTGRFGADELRATALGVRPAGPGD